MIAILNYAHLLPLLISAILSLKTFRLRWTLTYKIFCIALWAELLTEAIAISYSYYQCYYLGVKNVNNAWIVTIGIIVQTMLYILTYYTIQKSQSSKRYIIALLIAFTAFGMYNFLWGQGATTINSYTHLSSSIATIICIFLYLEQVRKEHELKDIIKVPIIWISLALFTFSLLNIPYIMSINYLNINYKSLAKAFMYVYLTIIFVCNLLIIKAFLCPTPQQK